MPLQELVSLPDTVDLQIPYNETLINYLQGKEDYMQIGKILRGNLAIVYVRGDRINRVLRDLGSNNINYIPVVSTLMGTSDMQAARNIASTTRKFIQFKRKRSSCSDL